MVTGRKLESLFGLFDKPCVGEGGVFSNSEKLFMLAVENMRRTSSWERKLDKFRLEIRQNVGKAR